MERGAGQRCDVKEKLVQILFQNRNKTAKKMKDYVVKADSEISQCPDKLG